MSFRAEEYIQGALAGRDRSVPAKILRGIMALAEPAYVGLMRGRNWMYKRGLFAAHPLGRPTISVGNITAGGTGKTPMVIWLAQRMREKGLHPAVLLRGYKRRGEMLSDEAAMLDALLNEAQGRRTIVEANADRRAGAKAALAEDAGIDAFILDDGFQHRRAARDFDLVLISAAEPFGFGHVHPRGLLREPLSGLGRADAVVITRADGVSEAEVQRIEAIIRRHNPSAPIYRASHVLTGLRREGENWGVEELRRRRFFAFAGIGQPEALGRQLEALGGNCVGHRWFGDHHAYSLDDVRKMAQEAIKAGAEMLVTTEKDWVKIARFGDLSAGMPIWRLEMEVRFKGNDGSRLMDQVERATKAVAVGAASAAVIGPPRTDSG